MTENTRWSLRVLEQAQNIDATVAAKVKPSCILVCCTITPTSPFVPHNISSDLLHKPHDCHHMFSLGALSMQHPSIHLSWCHPQWHPHTLPRNAPGAYTNITLITMCVHVIDHPKSTCHNHVQKIPTRLQWCCLMERRCSAVFAQLMYMPPTGGVFKHKCWLETDKWCSFPHLNNSVWIWRVRTSHGRDDMHCRLKQSSRVIQTHVDTLPGVIDDSKFCCKSALHHRC